MPIVFLALLGASLAGLYFMPTSFFMVVIPASFAAAFMPAILLALKVPEKVVKYVAVIAAGIVIGLLSTDANFGLTINFVLMPVVAALYFDRKFIIQMSVIGWVIMVVGLWFRTPGMIAREVAERTIAERFSNAFMGFTAEYVAIVIILIFIAGRASGLLANVFSKMKESKDTEAMLVADLTKMHHEYTIVGDMHYTMDESKYQGAYKDLIVLMNKLFMQITADIEELGTAIEKIGGGDFNTYLDESVWVGGWAVYPQRLNNVSANMKKLSSEMESIIAAIRNGDLSFRVDASGYKGEWGGILDGLNDIAETVNASVQPMLIAINEMKIGNMNLADIDSKIVALGYGVDANEFKGAFRELILAFDETVMLTSKYIEDISDDLVAISSGDLTTVIEGEWLGSFTLIKTSLNSISAQLHKTMSEISDVSNQVLSGAAQISNSAADLASGAQEQTSSVEELAVTIDMINQQTRQNADNAVIATEISNKSTANAQDGNEAMKQMVEAMTKIKESSNDISMIVKTIQDIAFQTNLLALNASVEAARAGEHGKGFSVVAEEVRTLAGRSQTAATETTALIHDSISRVETGSNIAGSTAESLNAIVDSANEVLGVISNISAASKEQAEAIASISDGIAQIAKVTQNNSAVSEEAAAASEELNSQAEMLQRLVEYFKL